MSLTFDGPSTVRFEGGAVYINDALFMAQSSKHEDITLGDGMKLVIRGAFNKFADRLTINGPEEGIAHVCFEDIGDTITDLHCTGSVVMTVTG